MYVCIYIHICIHLLHNYKHTYIYIYIEREREIDISNLLRSQEDALLGGDQFVILGSDCVPPYVCI